MTAVAAVRSPAAEQPPTPAPPEEVFRFGQGRPPPPAAWRDPTRPCDDSCPAVRGSAAGNNGRCEERLAAAACNSDHTCDCPDGTDGTDCSGLSPCGRSRPPRAPNPSKGSAQVFAFTGADQTFVVPAGVRRLTAKLWGGGGGGGVWNRDGSHSAGGGGGYTVGVLDVTPGETLRVMVGEGGYTARAMTEATYGGGGLVQSDWDGAPNGQGHAGCGGGRSAVFRQSTELATAGGGGGGGEGLSSWNDGHGGGGGGLEGRPATDNGLAYSGDGTLGGGGGTQSERGGGGTGPQSSDPHVGASTNNPLAGSGGGGWFGGGAPTGNDKSGGGGSGYVDGLVDGLRGIPAPITLQGSDGSNVAGAGGVGGAAAGQTDIDFPGGRTGSGGSPQDGARDVSTGSGGKAGDGAVVVRWENDDPADWAAAIVEDVFGGPLDCATIHLALESDECITGAQTFDTLWRDRNYGWVTGPADILDGRWTYIRPALETGSGAPCPSEGGFRGALDQAAVAAICCANHCGSSNEPSSTGDPQTWTLHPGTWAISGHGGEPCSFFETRLAAGQWHICCSSCWASGVFLALAPDNAGEDSSGPVDCGSLTATVRNSECIAAVTADAPLWSDRDYSWVEGQIPTDLLDGEWSYMRSSLEVGNGAACPHEGGFRGQVAEHAVVALCCANHCGGEGNAPTGTTGWTQHPGSFGISGHGGTPCTFFEARLQPGAYQLCCETCWASGAFFSHFNHPLPIAEDASVGSIGALLCEAIVSDTSSECQFQVDSSATLWSDRSYAWVSGPSDILDGMWSYVRVPLEVNSGAPCPSEGGFRGSVREDAVVAVCCANHCGGPNQPTGSVSVWTEHPGTWAISGHGGEPCTFFESRVGAGDVSVCCSTCWSSGAFFAMSETLGLIEGTGAVPCSAVVSDSVTSCVEGAALASLDSSQQTLWSDRAYAWLSAPVDMLDGGWTYLQVPLEVGSGAPCPHEGGFSGSIQVEAVVAVCCANHCGQANLPASGSAALTWTQHPGTFAISGHGGAPCTFFEAQVSSAEYSICCESCWASGIFVAGQASEPASCKEILDGGTRIDGVYRIDPDGPGGMPSFSVFCDMTTAGGGWALVQDREDDVPTVLTRSTVVPGDHGQAIDDKRFAAMKPGTTQVLLVSSGDARFVVEPFDSVISDVSTLNQANCRSWDDVTTLLHTPLIWDEDTGCMGQGGDYSELLGHGNAADGGGLEVLSTTHATRQNFIGHRSSLQNLYRAADGGSEVGEGEFQYVAMYIRAGGSRCNDEASWPDLDTSVVPGVCGECKVLVTNFHSTYQFSCVTYCESVGRSCVGAWEEDGDTCTETRAEGCDAPVDNWAGTSDAICECGDMLPPGRGTRCDEASWPDLDTTLTSGICGECKVLVDVFNTKYQSSCVTYCESIGRSCVGAWEEQDDNCVELRSEGCDAPAGNWGGTSDAICECGDMLPPGGYSRCDEASWPDLDTSVVSGVCDECKVLVTNFHSTYQFSCVTYCETVGRSCVGAWEEDGDTCTETRAEGCDAPAGNWAGTSDAICECGDMLPPGGGR